MEIIINDCYGGFSFSKKVYDELGLEWDGYGWLDRQGINPRTDDRVIEIVKKLGSREASGSCANLKIIEIPDDVDYFIDEYDGVEVVRECHRTWS